MGTAALLATVVAASLVLGQSQAVELSVVNCCGFPIWLATTANSGKSPLPGGTIRLDSGQRHAYQIPGGGWAGRFWPKINCNGAGDDCEFGQSSPPCPAQGCHPPADTKVEFYFPSQPPHEDAWYDISLVDGYSLPMKIEPRGVNQGACITTNCAMSLDNCPQNEVEGIGDLRVFRNGKVVACLSPCKRWNFPSPYGLGRPETDSPGVNMCCPTPPISPQQCSSGPVIRTNYVQAVHAHCPSAYSYAYDDAAGLHNCPGETSFDVTMCPGGGGGGGSGGGNEPETPCTEWGWKFYDDYDIVDNDMGSQPAGHRNDCQDACRNKPGCQGYTWSNGVCYFKNGASKFNKSPGIYSARICNGGGGGKAPKTPCTQWGWKFYDDYDIVGNDMGSQPAGHRNDCQDACRNKPGCQGYTWSNWSNGVCFFKNGASQFNKADGIYSARICNGGGEEDRIEEDDEDDDEVVKDDDEEDEEDKDDDEEDKDDD